MRKINLKEKIKNFREWQQRPFVPAPLPDVEHECANCHDLYKGAFCPRCGQSAKIGRYSLKTAFKNFIDVWGLGNRGMFRAIRDLILRPGYMIRDYLGGMQMSYFPPFKMFFLLAALSLAVANGMNIKGKTFSDEEILSEPETEIVEQTETEKNVDTVTYSEDKKSTSELTSEQREFLRNIPRRIINSIERFDEKFPNIVTLLLLMILSGGLYLFFRHCPNIPDLRYSEFFVALVYSNNMYSIYTITFYFLCLPTLVRLSIFLLVIPLKQMSGYSWWQTILRFLVAGAVMFVLVILLLTLFIIGLILIVKMVR